MAEAAMILLENILSESIGCKNPAFREEREVRLIYSYDPYRNGDDWNKKSRLVICSLETIEKR